MALRETARSLRTCLLSCSRPCTVQTSWRSSREGVRNSSTTSADVQELEESSSLTSSSLVHPNVKAFDPVAQARARTEQLPRSRYQFRPPRYYRGPLHPYQPPPPSDPASREFIPGPFSVPRLQQTYDSTIAPDIMTLSYQHVQPGYEAPEKPDRRRKWEGDSPYFAGRPRRTPRGGDNLRLRRKTVTFRNVPRITGVTVHSMVKQAVENSKWLHVAGMAVQAITGVRAEAHATKSDVQQWRIRKGKFLSVTAKMTGEDMFHFLSTTIDVVMPRIRDFKGIKPTTGDRSGNISFGLSPDAVSLYPEIEINYDMYPAKSIPGCHVTIHTSATNDKDARLLMTAIGIPFDGKIVS